MKEATTLIEFLLQPADGNSELTTEYLKNTGIDIQGKNEELSEYIKKKKAEYRLERGRKLKEKLAGLKSNLTSEYKPEINRQDLILAYRNLEGVDEKDIKEIEEDTQLLKELEDFINNEK